MAFPYSLNTALGGLPKSIVYPAIAVLLLVAYQFLLAVYNLFFHPLRSFPGPILHRASRIPWAMAHVSGRKPFYIHEMHEKYGPIVRVAPNFLTFTDPQAWRDIYGHRLGIGSAPEMGKSAVFYRAATVETSIVSADREEHGRLRRALAHGFSDRALREQEPLIMRHVDLLMQRLVEYGDGGKQALDAGKWFNWTTFDITGDLIFAQDFGGLRRVSYDPFVSLVFRTVKELAMVSALRYLGLGFLMAPFVLLGGLKNFNTIRQDIGSRLKKRMESKDDRPDLIEGLLKKRQEWNLNDLKLRSNSVILTIAGSETTATQLAGVTYLLLSHPEILEKLRDEVHSKFNHVNEITIASVSTMPYLLAVLNEGLRFYPPLTGGLVRDVPEQGGEILGRFVPAGTHVEAPVWAMHHSRNNWVDPFVFRPERFLDKGLPGDNMEAMQPFSYGPRNCIGRNLAIAEMRLIIARIIFQFDIKLGLDGKNWIERQSAYGIWVKPALPVHFTPR